MCNTAGMVDDSIQKIRDWLALPNTRKGDLATAAGVHRNSLLGVESGTWNPSANTLRDLCAAIDRLSEK